MRERQPEQMLRVIAETTERVDVFRTRRVRTCLSLSVNKIHPSLHEPTLSASFLPYELCYSISLCTGAYDWAKKTLQDHAKDRREYLYTKEQLENAKTHDQLWNAAQVAQVQFKCVLVQISKALL